MSVVRAFAPEGWSGATGEELTLEREESHYAVRVRRRRAGDALELLVPGGGGYHITLLDADAKRCRVQIGDAISDRPCLSIQLAVGIVDSKAAIDVLSRACEMGAASLQWIVSSHSQAAAPSTARSERVLRAAQRQCGRLSLPEVCAPQSLSTWLDQSPAGYVAALGGLETADTPSPLGIQALLVGPEGGLSQAEQAEAVAHGLAPLRLGPYVLRTEVAVVAGLAAVSQHC